MLKSLFGFLGWQTTAAKLFFSKCHFAGWFPSVSGNSSNSSWGLSAIGLPDFLQQLLEADSSIVLQCKRSETCSREGSLHCSFYSRASSVFSYWLAQVAAFAFSPTLPSHTSFPLFWHGQGSCLIFWTAVPRCSTLPPSLPQGCGHTLAVFCLQHLQSHFLYPAVFSHSASS